MKQNEIITKFKLPSYIQGKSFAEASTLIDKKFEGRNDMMSKTTKEELLNRLADAQEYVKSQSQPEPIGQSQLDPMNQSQFADGGGMAGFLDENSEIGKQSMDVSSALSSIISPGGSYGKQMVKNENSGFYDEKLQQDQAIGKSLDTVKDTVASAAGPLGMAVRAGQKLGMAVGDAIGGDAGSAASSMIDPTTSQISNLTNKDMKIGDRLLGVIPGISGIKASQAAEKRLNEFQTQKRKTDYFNNYLNTQNNNGVNVNAKGGYINQYKKGGPFDIPQIAQSTEKDQPVDKFNPIIDYTLVDNILANKKQTMSDSASLNDVNRDYEGNQFETEVIDTTEPKKTKKFDLNNINMSSLRGVPLAMDAYQLATMGKPDVESLGRLNNKYQKQFLDEKTYENMVKQQAAAASNAIGRSGVSTGQMIASNLGIQLNATRGMADAYNNMKQHNIGERKLEQQTEFNNAQVNLTQGNAENDINARNKGAFKTERSRLLGNLGTSIGQVGKEQLFKQYPKMMGLGYNWNGKYFQNESGDIMNRYTQLSTSKFDPLSLKEVLAVPLYRQKQHDDLDQMGIDANASLQLDPDSKFYDTAQGLKTQMDEKFTNLSSELAKNGYNPN